MEKTSRLLPIHYLVDSENRIYFGYLISSMVLAGFYYAYYRKRKRLKNFFSYFFNHKVLFHASSRTDIYLFIFNYWLKFFLVIPILFSEVKIIYLIKDSLTELIPTYNPIFLSPISYSVCYTFIFFITADFSRFILHYCFHKISFLWEIHKVHHSAKVLTPLTLYRTHPLEAVAFLIRQIIVTGLVAGTFAFFIEGKYPMITIFGVQILGFIFNLVGSNLRHSHIPFSFGAKLETILISPIMHQMHHSINWNKNSKNLGSCLAIWDILFSTYLRPDFKPIRFGLSKNQRKKRLVNHIVNPLGIFQQKP